MMRGNTRVQPERPTLDELRAAAKERVGIRGLRSVAREIGMSRTGLKDFMAGATPYLGTASLLRAWYSALGAGPADDAALPPHPLAGISDSDVRGAVDREVRETSLRSVADEVGLTPVSLKGYMTGRTRPRETTLRKLYEWFMDQPASTDRDDRLHSKEWRAALSRIETIRPRVASIYRRILREIENGWAILRPLASAAQPMEIDPEQPPLAAAAAWAIGRLVADFLELAKSACYVVPGGLFGGSVISLDEANLGDPEHLLRLLRSSAADPAFPENLRALCLDASAAFDQWLTQYVAAVQPLRKRVARQTERRLREQGFDLPLFRRSFPGQAE